MTEFPRLYEDKQEEGNGSHPPVGVTDEETNQQDTQVLAEAAALMEEMVEWTDQGQNRENLRAAVEAYHDGLSAILSVAVYQSRLAPFLLPLGGGDLLNTIRGLAFELGYKAAKTDGR